MSYAKLGHSCASNTDVLIDNKKFFPINDPIYDIFYTKMRMYPSTYPNIPPIQDLERPEELKTKARKYDGNEEDYKCGTCGKK